MGISKAITKPVTAKIETKVAGKALVILGSSQITNIVNTTKPRE